MPDDMLPLAFEARRREKRPGGEVMFDLAENPGSAHRRPADHQSADSGLETAGRIREGLHSGRRGSVQTIMNASINETLSRTILTGGTVLLTVLALYFFGGPVLNDFAFSFVIGVIVGTYSSIFTAAPIVLWWSGKGGHDLRSEVKQVEAPKPATA